MLAMAVQPKTLFRAGLGTLIVLLIIAAYLPSNRRFMSLFRGETTENTPVTPPVVQPPPPPVQPPPPPVKPTQPATSEQAVATKYSYKIYENKKKPEQFVELSEFSTVCKEMGDIFANNELVLNPTFKNEQKIPLSRVSAISFEKLGLTDPTIKGVGKVNQPVGYRDNKISLKNPDETIEGIVVICRDLKGKKTDGTPWTANLKLETGYAFSKIEITEAPK